MAKVICACSVVFILLGIGSAIHRFSYLRDAVMAQATISKIIESKNERGTLEYTTVYVFSDQNGKEVRVVTAEADRPPVAKPGDAVEILYLPNDPRQSIENHFLIKWGFSLITGGLGFLYFLTFAIIAHFTTKHLERMGEPVSAAA